MSDKERPDELRVPFIFVPHGEPEPTEWMAAHPGWVKFPAVMVPRDDAEPPSAWPATAAEPAAAASAADGPAPALSTAPGSLSAAPAPTTPRAAAANDRYAAYVYDPTTAYL